MSSRKSAKTTSRPCYPNQDPEVVFLDFFAQNLIERWIATVSCFITKPFLLSYCKKLRLTPSVLPGIWQSSPLLWFRVYPLTMSLIMFIRSITRLTFDKNLEITYWRAYIMSKMTHIYINQAWNPHPIMYTHINKKSINSICICRICAKIQLKG